MLSLWDLQIWTPANQTRAAGPVIRPPKGVASS
jgi:hypothetical protein